MSERCDRSFSNSSLLMDASISAARPGVEREALVKYKQTYSKSIASNARLQKLNEKITEMSFAGETDSGEFVQYRAEAEQCVKDISKFDREAYSIMNSNLMPLVKRLQEDAFAEELSFGQIPDVRTQIRQIDEELSHLKFCWFGEKRRYKAKLKKQKKMLEFLLTSGFMYK